jgi:hypothetical protein
LRRRLTLSLFRELWHLALRAGVVLGVALVGFSVAGLLH